jgi:hypothetical protein
MKVLINPSLEPIIISHANPAYVTFGVRSGVGFDRLDQTVGQKKLYCHTISYTAINSWQLEASWKLFD